LPANSTIEPGEIAVPHELHVENRREIGFQEVQAAERIRTRRGRTNGACETGRPSPEIEDAFADQEQGIVRGKDRAQVDQKSTATYSNDSPS
jgi:hypothetical protein